MQHERRTFTITKDGQTVTAFGREGTRYQPPALEVVDFTETGGGDTPGYLGVPWWAWLLGGLGLFVLVRR